MKRVKLKKNASFKRVFELLQVLKLTPFEMGLMTRLITRMMNHSQYDDQVHDYYLEYAPHRLATSDADSWPKIRKAFRDFQQRNYVKVVKRGTAKRLFFNFIQIVK